MSKTFKALSALLSYPEEALQKAAPELRKVLDEESRSEAHTSDLHSH